MYVYGKLWEIKLQIISVCRPYNIVVGPILSVGGLFFFFPNACRVAILRVNIPTLQSPRNAYALGIA